MDRVNKNPIVKGIDIPRMAFENKDENGISKAYLFIGEKYQHVANVHGRKAPYTCVAFEDQSISAIGYTKPQALTTLYLLLELKKARKENEK